MSVELDTNTAALCQLEAYLGQHVCLKHTDICSLRLIPCGQNVTEQHSYRPIMLTQTVLLLATTPQHSVRTSVETSARVAEVF